MMIKQVNMAKMCHIAVKQSEADIRVSGGACLLAWHFEPVSREANIHTSDVQIDAPVSVSLGEGRFISFLCVQTVKTVHLFVAGTDLNRRKGSLKFGGHGPFLPEFCFPFSRKIRSACPFSQKILDSARLLLKRIQHHNIRYETK